MNWKSVKLGDVLKTGAGGTPLKSKKEYYENGNISWLLSGGVCEKEITQSSTFITNAGLKNSSAKLFPPNTVLVAMYGATAGQVGILRVESATNQAVCGIYPDENFLPEFLYYFLLSYKDKLLEEVSGVAQPNLSQVKIKNTSIPLLPLPVQKRIVEKLDAAFADIDKPISATEKNIENAEALFQRKLFDTFEGENSVKQTSSVGELAEHCLGKIMDKNKNRGELQPYLRNTNVQWFTVNTDDILKMKFEPHEAERFSAKKGDLLICEGGYPGRAAIWEEEKAIYFQKALHRVRCKEPMLNKWLLFYLYYLSSTNKLTRYFTVAGIQHFTGKSLKQLPVPVPPPQDTSAYVELFDLMFHQVENLKSTLTKKIALYTSLKSSILNQAFSGELTMNAA